MSLRDNFYGRRNFGLALDKMLMENKEFCVKAFCELGGKHWQKEGIERVYFSLKELGVVTKNRQKTFTKLEEYAEYCKSELTELSDLEKFYLKNILQYLGTAKAFVDITNGYWKLEGKPRLAVVGQPADSYVIWDALDWALEEKVFSVLRQLPPIPVRIEHYETWTEEWTKRPEDEIEALFWSEPPTKEEWEAMQEEETQERDRKIRNFYGIKEEEEATEETEEKEEETKATTGAIGEKEEEAEEAEDTEEAEEAEATEEEEKEEKETPILAVTTQTLEEQTIANVKTLCATYKFLLNKATGFTELVETPTELQFVGLEDQNNAHQMLVQYLVNFAKTAKTIKAKEELHPNNEKFTFRIWLTKLGWKGRETSKERTSLYKGLDGNTAFCTAESKANWKAKWKEAK